MAIGNAIGIGTPMVNLGLGGEVPVDKQEIVNKVLKKEAGVNPFPIIDEAIEAVIEIKKPII